LRRGWPSVGEVEVGESGRVAEEELCSSAADWASSSASLSL